MHNNDIYTILYLIYIPIKECNSRVILTRFKKHDAFLLIIPAKYRFEFYTTQQLQFSIFLIMQFLNIIECVIGPKSKYIFSLFLIILLKLYTYLTDAVLSKMELIISTQHLYGHINGYTNFDPDIKIIKQHRMYKHNFKNIQYC